MILSFQSQPSPALVHDAVSAFKAAVNHTAVESTATKYRVEGAKGTQLGFEEVTAVKNDTDVQVNLLLENLSFL